jgi:hypothetical protein
MVLEVGVVYSGERYCDGCDAHRQMVRRRATIHYRISICVDSSLWLSCNACRMQKLLNGFAKNTEILPMNWTSEVVVAGQRLKLGL